MYSTRGTPYLFPLYVYPDPNELISTSPWLPGKHNRRPNLNPDFVREMEGKLGLRFVSDGQGDLQATFGPEDVFHYIYAVFHSPAYRERYAEFLKRNFPRVPLTSNVALFRALCDHGAALVGLHLLERVPAPTVRYPIKGNDAIESGYPKYTEPTADTPGRVYVNKTQYFEGVAPEIWEFHVGGYQVCDKWLKDRRGRALSYEDVTHYERIVAALGETIRRMEAIDALIDDHGGWPLQ